MNKPTKAVDKRTYSAEIRFYRSQVIANTAVVATSILLGVYLYSVGGFPWIMGLPVVISGFSTFTSYMNYKKFVKFQAE